MDVQKREDRMLDSMRKLYERKEMTLMQLDLNEYAYPELMPVWDALRACLKGADE